MTPLEEQFYEIAALEVAERRGVPAAMAKAFADADGDEKRAIALYLKIRVAQLSKLHHEEVIQRAAQEAERRKAEEDARLYPYRPIEVKCHKCGNKEIINGSKAHFVETYRSFRARASGFFVGMVLVCITCKHKFRFFPDVQ